MEPELPFDAEETADDALAERGSPVPRVRRRIVSAHDAAVRRRRWIVRAVVASSTVLMVNALVGTRGYLAANYADRKYDELNRQIEAAELENQRLIEEIERLRVDPSALEEAVRQELRFIKEGEVLVVESPAKPAVPGTRPR